MPAGLEQIHPEGMGENGAFPIVILTEILAASKEELPAATAAYQI